MDTDVQQLVLVKEEAPGVDQQDPEHLHIKVEQEELRTSLEGEQLHLKEETDATRFPFTKVSIKSEDEEQPLFSHLHQQQIKDTSDTEVSGDDEEVDDVNLDSELSDSGSEIGDGDNVWNESRSSLSDVRTVKAFSCPECGKQFLHKWSLQKHVRVTSHSAFRSSGCLVNKKCVGVKQHVESSRKVEKELKSFSCDDFGKRLKGKSHLNRHMRVHTGEKPFTCELCGQRFSDKGNLNSHMRVHTGHKPFTCELCGQRFSQKTNLNSHMRVHTGQKRFTCELCGQKFSVKANLNNHMVIHTGQKPFACELCGKRFSQKTSLNSHMRVHTGQKPFVCESCGQRFSDKGNLNRHTRVHTGQKPYACELCGQSFSRKTCLNNHMGVHIEQKEPLTTRVLNETLTVFIF